MRVLVAFFSLALLSGCGEDSPAKSGFVRQIEDVGNSYKLLSCSEASLAISSMQSSSSSQPQLELGMSEANIRAIVGKPRHIYDGVWTFGYEWPVNGSGQVMMSGSGSFDWVPTVTVADHIGATAFSGDNTLCDGSELPFISDANDLINSSQTTSHRNEVPNCATAARRIAARIELGMTVDDVHDLVGRPVEITPAGHYRYKYSQQGQVDGPLVLFEERALIEIVDGTVEPYFGDTALVVVGYSTPISLCNQ